MKLTEYHVGKRLLIKDAERNASCAYEITLVELNKDQSMMKVRRPHGGEDWTENLDFFYVEVLRPATFTPAEFTEKHFLALQFGFELFKKLPEVVNTETKVSSSLYKNLAKNSYRLALLYTQAVKEVVKGQ